MSTSSPRRRRDPVFRGTPALLRFLAGTFDVRGDKFLESLTGKRKLAGDVTPGYFCNKDAGGYDENDPMSFFRRADNFSDEARRRRGYVDLLWSESRRRRGRVRG